MAQIHTPATASIQRRLERWELAHLRALAAVQAEEIERLRSDLAYAEDCAEMWQRDHDNLSDHLASGTADARCIGITQSGELLVIEVAA